VFDCVWFATLFRPEREMEKKGDKEKVKITDKSNLLTID